MKVIFMGSPQFAVPAFVNLIGSSHIVSCVYTKAPKPSGRGQRVNKTPVHLKADEFNVPVFSPSSLRSVGEIEKFKSLKIDVAVVAAYGLMLPRAILEIPVYGCINIHPSLLPRWRGASPIQSAILAGDHETGVTVMQMNEYLDAGDILLQRSVSLAQDDNAFILHDKLSALGAEMILEVLDNFNSITPIPQGGKNITYADKIIDYQIDLRDEAEVICRKIRALYPKAFLVLDGKRIRILQATYSDTDDNSCSAGEILNNEMYIKCGNNSVLIPKILQIEGKKPCIISDFLNGLQGSLIGHQVDNL